MKMLVEKCTCPSFSDVRSHDYELYHELTYHKDPSIVTKGRTLKQQILRHVNLNQSTPLKMNIKLRIESKKTLQKDLEQKEKTRVIL